MKKIKKKWIKIRIPSFTALIIAAVLALTACSGCGGDAETSQTATTATKTTGVSTTEAVTTKKQAVKDTSKSKETTVPEERKTEQGTTKSGGNAEDTTVWEPVTEAPGHDEPGTTAHQHSWVWVEPVTHVETIYEQVYHPPVTHEWTHLLWQGSQWRCLRCNATFLNDRECVEHCIECGGSMTEEPHYVEVTETVVDQEEYWSEEAVGTKTVIDSEGYWKCSECGSLK